MFFESKHRFRKMRSYKNRENVKQCHHNPSEIVEISENPDNDELKSRHQKSGVFSDEL